MNNVILQINFLYVFSTDKTSRYKDTSNDINIFNNIIDRNLLFRTHSNKIKPLLHGLYMTFLLEKSLMRMFSYEEEKCIIKEENSHSVCIQKQNLQVVFYSS